MSNMKKLIKKKFPVTIIRRSCLTGDPVWIYRGASKAGARQAYWRACKAEIERVHNWSQTMAQRAANITRFISQCMERLPIDAELTLEQLAAAKQLRAILKKEPVLHKAFYDHIMEERKRRAEDHEIRRQMREREELEKWNKIEIEVRRRMREREALKKSTK